MIGINNDGDITECRMSETCEKILEKMKGYLKDGVVVIGPAGEKDNLLRIYCGGGDVGKIDIVNDKHAIHKEIDYAMNHLKGQEQTELLKLIESSKDAAEILQDDNYIKLMIKATMDYGYKNGKKSIYQGKRIKKERLIETTILKNQFEHLDEKDLIAYDIEYERELPIRRIINKKGEEVPKKARPDFMVFDGKTIGIVELKYDADSMTGLNSIANHYEDFMDLIWNGSDSDRWDILDETVYRMEKMRDANLLPEWDERIKGIRKWYKENRNGVFITDIFWIGFLFVEGPHKKKTPKRIPCKDYVEEETKKQLKIPMGKMLSEGKKTMVRYGYCSNEEKPEIILDKKVIINEKGEAEIN